MKLSKAVTAGFVVGTVAVALGAGAANAAGVDGGAVASDVLINSGVAAGKGMVAWVGGGLMVLALAAAGWFLWRKKSIVKNGEELDVEAKTVLESLPEETVSEAKEETVSEAKGETVSEATPAETHAPVQTEEVRGTDPEALEGK